MGRSQESFHKKEVRKKKEKKRKEKEKKKQARKEAEKSSSLDDMIAYVDAEGNITDAPPDPEEHEEINAEDIDVGIPPREEGEEEDTERKGRVAYFSDSKGYGFIKDSQTQESVFVHINDVVDDIQEGIMVSYEITKGRKGPAAINVKKA